MKSLSGQLVTPAGVLSGTVQFDNTITALTEHKANPDVYILPGFIDTHVHGGGGADTMDGAEGVRQLARFHARHGTTTLLPTTITNPWENILAALEGIAAVRQKADPSLPSIPGAHVEGPFISPERLGAQPPFALEATAERVSELLDTGVVRVMTVAPEVAGVLTAVPALVKRGVRVSIGHTVAGYDETVALMQCVRAAGGVVGFTHLFNAMQGLGSREPGGVGAALADDTSFCELILDGHHVHSAAFKLSLKARSGHLHLITDAIRATGLPEGTTELGGQQVTVAAGAARLADNTLAGSVLTLDQALRNVLGLGVSLPQASASLSGVAARYLGLADRGALQVGLRADMMVLNKAFEVTAVYVAGEQVTQ
jgi:N-acetylglucosamine-6-phosphate deacetylase